MAILIARAIYTPEGKLLTIDPEWRGEVPTYYTVGVLEVTEPIDYDEMVFA